MIAFDVLSCRNPGVAQNQVGLLQPPAPPVPRARGKRASGANTSLTSPRVQGLLSADGLSGKKEVAAPIGAQQHGVNDVYPVAGHQSCS